VAELAEGPAVPSAWRREVRALGELFALCGFAITQPLLDLFGRGTEQFALRGASSAQIVLFAVAVTVLPAFGMWVGEVVVGLVRARLRTPVHRVAVFVLVAVVVIQAARPLTTGWPLLGLAVAVGAGATVAYVRAAVVRIWLAFAALAPVGFLVLFLVASPTAELLGDDPATADVTVGDAAPVVMVVLDELPLGSLLTADGDLDASLYPNIAALAGDAHWFRNTTSVTSSTWHAVPSILTGRYPEDDTSPVASEHPDNLFTLLGGAYDLHVTETVSRMCPASLCPPQTSSRQVWRGLAGDAKRVLQSRLSLHRRQDDPVTGFAELSDGEQDFLDFGGDQPARFRALIDSLDDGGTALHYLHILLPHVPYRYLPSGNVYEAPEPDLGRRPAEDLWTAEPWTAALGRQRHLLQLQYVDSLIGTLVAELRAAGLYDDAAIVLTADHGISFRADGPIRGLEGQAVDDLRLTDLAWVPLFVKEPGQTEGDVSDANVQSIDVLPTLADILDVDLPYEVDGQSALGPPRSTTDKPFQVTDVIPFGVALLEPETIEGPAGWRRVLADTVEAFAPDVGDPQRLFRIGPSAELVGQPVADLGAGALESIDVTLRDPAAFDAVPEAGQVPALVRGQVPGASPGQVLAVAVNGVIGATGPVYLDDDGQPVFAVMVDDALLRAGANQIDVYVIPGVRAG
jgi:hypothetical protein